MKTPCLPLSILALLLTACATTTSRSIRLGTETFPSRPDDHPVALFDNFADIPGPFVRVARVHAEGRAIELLRLPMWSPRGPSWEEVLGELRTEARLVGADAIVLEPDTLEALQQPEQVRRVKTVDAVAIRLK